METEKTSDAIAIENVLTIMERLRGPGGCPWDRKQTHYSLKRYLLEEVYEFFEALDDQDVEGIREELGDILLQIVFHAQIGKENGTFSFAQICEQLANKLIRRHPHVFADAVVRDADHVLQRWQEIKKEEKPNKDKGISSILAPIPRELPALMRAQKLQERAAEVGFDWVKAEDVLVKLEEEIQEIKEAIHSHDLKAIEEEAGDLLFVMVNFIRKLGLDAENSLRKANQKFISRFQWMENRLAERDQKMENCSLEELDQLWNQAKCELGTKDQN